MSVAGAIPGYHSRYLRVDLTSRRATVVPLPADVLRQFLGGSGLGTWLLLNENAAAIDPLSPAAPLAFIFSPLVGSPLTTSAKFAVMARSPLTERINDSLSSSHFAIAGKKTGHDAIVVVGAADEPLCLIIDNDEVRFEPATDVWGLSSRESGERLRQRLGSNFRVAAIGPAGEKLVRYATISHDGRHAGRGGLGAVMGAKQLKAIAVTGDRLTEFADPDGLIAFAKDLSKKSFGPATEKYRELGTVSNLLVFNRLGTLPTRNFQAGSFESAASLSPEQLTQDRERTRASCAACTIGCEHIFPIVAEPHRDSNFPTSVRLEYESLFALGSLCGISDPQIVLRAAALCDEFGLDTISTGGTIAFAMECAERGLLSEPQLRFGHGEALLETIALIGRREGLGVLLSLGSRAAARQIGHGSEAFAAHVKGLEIPGYEPRSMQTMALGFAVGARGADHNRSGAYQADFSNKADRLHADETSVVQAIETENEAALFDSLILCKFLRGVFDDKLAAMSDMLRLVTGWTVTPAELIDTANRIVTAKKQFNIRAGWTPAEDTLPARFFDQPLAAAGEVSTGAQLTREQLQRLVRSYNVARGWTPDGWIAVAETSADGYVLSASPIGRGLSDPRNTL